MAMSVQTECWAGVAGVSSFRTSKNALGEGQGSLSLHDINDPTSKSAKKVHPSQVGESLHMENVPYEGIWLSFHVSRTNIG